MPRYVLRMEGDEVEKQYANLPEDTRQLVNQRIEELLENPTGHPDWRYEKQFDQHYIPIGDADNDKGLILYTVVESARMVFVLRFTPGLD
jgi:mRNA-degrading endonuclease RelE of RelBE toxin-antitoxin system